VAVPEQEDVAAELAQPVDHAVDALGHLLRRLAPRTPISEQLPPRMDLLDLLSGQPFELAVVDFEQPLVHPDPVSEPGEPAGLPGSEHRARKDVVEAAAGEELADRDGLQLPLGRERDIRAPGVLSRDRPLGLAVPNQPHRHRARA
jgi:hypothetical protein